MNKPKLIEEFEYHGMTFSVLANAEKLKITHAVCGDHVLRGPMVVRWMKEHPKPDERRKEILDGIFNLYGSAVSAIKFVSVYEKEPA